MAIRFFHNAPHLTARTAVPMPHAEPIVKRSTVGRVIDAIHLKRSVSGPNPEIKAPPIEVTDIKAPVIKRPDIRSIIEVSKKRVIEQRLMEDAIVLAANNVSNEKVAKAIKEMKITGFYVESGTDELFCNCPVPGIIAKVSGNESEPDKMRFEGCTFAHNEAGSGKEGSVYVSRFLAEYLEGVGGVPITHMDPVEQGHDELTAAIAYQVVMLAGGTKEEAESAAISICRKSERNPARSRLGDTCEELDRLLTVLFRNRDDLRKNGFQITEFLTQLHKYRQKKISLKANYDVIRPEGTTGLEVKPPKDEDILDYKTLKPEFIADLIKDPIKTFSKITMLNPNGGLASRFGETIKCLTEVAEFAGKPRSFIEIKAALARWIIKKLKGTGPDRIIWQIMNSFATDGITMEYLKERRSFGLARGALSNSFVQGLSLRIVPTEADIDEYAYQERTRLEDRKEQLKEKRKRFGITQEDLQELLTIDKELTDLDVSITLFKAQIKLSGEGTIYYDPDVSPATSINPPGHADAVFRLICSEEYDETAGKMVIHRPLRRVLENNPEIEYIQVSNIDNLTGTPDVSLIELLEAHNTDQVHKGVLCELASKYPGDTGGALSRVNNRPQVVEQFCYNPKFKHSDPNSPDYIADFNTATYIIRVDALLKLFGITRDEYINMDPIELQERVSKAREKLFPVYAVIKTTTQKKKDSSGNMTEEPAAVLQFERLLGDITRVIETLYVRVPRERFYPIKKPSEIAKARRSLEENLKNMVDFQDELLKADASAAELEAMEKEGKTHIGFIVRQPKIDDSDAQPSEQIPPMTIDIARAKALVSSGKALILKEEVEDLAPNKVPYLYLLSESENDESEIDLVNLETQLALPAYLSERNSQLILDPRLPAVRHFSTVMTGTNEIAGYLYSGLRLITEARDYQRDNQEVSVLVVKPGMTTPWMGFEEFGAILQIAHGEAVINYGTEEARYPQLLPFDVEPNKAVTIKNEGKSNLVISILTHHKDAKKENGHG